MKIDRMELADMGNPTRIAATVLRQAQCQTPPVPIEEISFASGIEDIKELTTEGFEGALITDEVKNDGVILAQSSHGERRRRFTIAHELGHFLNPWHLPSDGQFRCTAQDMLASGVEGSPSRKIEAEANQFAAEILMPLPVFKERYREGGSNPTTECLVRLADEFFVSKVAMGRRLVAYESLCALVVSCNGVLDQVYRGDEFPFITLRAGMRVPKDVPTGRRVGSPGEHLEAEHVDPCAWTTTETSDKVEFLEHVFVQSGGYRLTLLVCQGGDPEDDEETWADERSTYNPTFRR